MPPEFAAPLPRCTFTTSIAVLAVCLRCVSCPTRQDDTIRAVAAAAGHVTDLDGLEKVLRCLRVYLRSRRPGAEAAARAVLIGDGAAGSLQAAAARIGLPGVGAGGGGAGGAAVAAEDADAMGEGSYEEEVRSLFREVLSAMDGAAGGGGSSRREGSGAGGDAGGDDRADARRKCAAAARSRTRLRRGADGAGAAEGGPGGRDDGCPEDGAEEDAPILGLPAAPSTGHNEL